MVPISLSGVNDRQLHNLIYSLVPAGTHETIVVTGTNKISGKILGEPYEDKEVGTTWLAKNIGVIKDKSTDSVSSEIYVLNRTNVRPPSKVLPFLPFLLDD